MHLSLRFLPGFVKHLILRFIEQQLTHLTDAEVVQGVDHVKEFILSVATATLES